MLPIRSAQTVMQDRWAQVKKNHFPLKINRKMISQKNRIKLIFFFTSLILMGCDPCKDVICLNEGICNDGVCQCQNAYEGSDCNTHKTPRSINFLKVEVNNIPELNLDGNPWDEDGSRADIVVVLNGISPNSEWRVQISKVIENITSDDSGDIGRPQGISSNIFQDVQTIGVYDKDEDPESYELICKYEWNTIQLAEETSYSSNISFTTANCAETHLEIEYGY